MQQQEQLQTLVVGYTDDGTPIVTPTYCCDFFIGEEDSLCLVKECWYCKHADFRKNMYITPTKSACHCTANKILLRKDDFYGF